MLGAYVRDGLSRRERTATENHIEHCSSCHVLVGELNEVNQLLVRSIVPLFLALPGQGIATAAAAATAGATAAARLGDAGARAASAAAGSGTTGAGAGAGAGAHAASLAGAADPSTVHGLLSALPWAKDAMSTAGGLAAAALVVLGLTAGTLVLRRDPGQIPPGAAGDAAAAATTSTTTTAPPGPSAGEQAMALGPPCAVLTSTGSDAVAGDASAIDGAGSTGNADSGDDPAPSPSATTTIAGAPTTSSTSMSSRGVPDATESTTRSGSGTGDETPLSLGGVLGSLLGKRR